MQNLAIKQEGLPRGQSKPEHWSGGRMLVTISGDFISEGHTSTIVTLNHSPRQSDGSSANGQRVAVYDKPGTYKIALSPGQYYFHASGPDKHDWKVFAEASQCPIEKPAHEKRIKDLERRVHALEKNNA